MDFSHEADEAPIRNNAYG